MHFVSFGMIHFLTNKVMVLSMCETMPEQLKASGSDNVGLLHREGEAKNNTRENIYCSFQTFQATYKPNS